MKVIVQSTHLLKPLTWACPESSPCRILAELADGGLWVETRYGRKVFDRHGNPKTWNLWVYQSIPELRK